MIFLMNLYMADIHYVQPAKMPAHTVIADISDVWPTKEQAKAAIADVAGTSYLLSAMGRYMSARDTFYGLGSIIS